MIKMINDTNMSKQLITINNWYSDTHIASGGKLLVVHTYQL